MVAKTDPIILQETYDNYRLWAVSSHTIRFSRELVFFPVLGKQANVEEFPGMLVVIYRTNVAILSPTWRSWGEKIEDSSPDRVGTGADWMYFIPLRDLLLVKLTCGSWMRM